LQDLKDQLFNVTKDVNKAVSNLQSISFTTTAESHLKQQQSKKALAKAQRKANNPYDDYEEEEEEEDDLEDEKTAEVMKFLFIFNSIVF
jgi:hypothetical protein